MKIKAIVLDSTTSDNKIIKFEVRKEDIYRVMRMLNRSGFQVDYRKVNY